MTGGGGEAWNDRDEGSRKTGELKAGLPLGRCRSDRGSRFFTLWTTVVRGRWQWHRLLHAGHGGGGRLLLRLASARRHGPDHDWNCDHAGVARHCYRDRPVVSEPARGPSKALLFGAVLAVLWLTSAGFFRAAAKSWSQLELRHGRS